MDDLDESKTIENLRKAFAEEAALAARYLYYATLAEFEGLEGHSALFQELAQSGDCGAQGCFDFLKLVKDPESGIPVGGTLKNLQSLIQMETRRQGRTYPEMAKMARREGFMDIASWFETLEKSKRAHLRKLRKLADG